MLTMGIVREMQNCNIAGFEDGGRGLSQGMWAAVETGKGNVTDSPPESPERNQALLTP